MNNNYQTQEQDRLLELPWLCRYLKIIFRCSVLLAMKVYESLQLQLLTPSYAYSFRFAASIGCSNALVTWYGMLFYIFPKAFTWQKVVLTTYLNNSCSHVSNINY